jgi:hypothetical protein
VTNAKGSARRNRKPACLAAEREDDLGELGESHGLPEEEFVRAARRARPPQTVLVQQERQRRASAGDEIDPRFLDWLFPTVLSFELQTNDIRSVRLVEKNAEESFRGVRISIVEEIVRRPRAFELPDEQRRMR